jgi:hypothetical protein
VYDATGLRAIQQSNFMALFIADFALPVKMEESFT